MVISIRIFVIFLVACLHWTPAKGEDGAVARLSSSTQAVASLETSVPEGRENKTTDLSGAQGARGFEVGNDPVGDPVPAGVSDLADDLVSRGTQTMMVAEYMYRL